MSERSDILETLLDQWEEAREAGGAPTPEEVCRDHPELLDVFREQVKALQHADALFAEPDTAAQPTVTPTARLAEQPGSTIGPYKILQTLGAGGMGEVFLADQTHPVRRRVALKVIKPGMDSKQVIARFEAERQALAVMDHHGIATVLDAGTTAQGRPYFVMEFVPGVPITRFADEHRLTLEDRLKLFTQVCEAISHAHQKAIIHRDIKAANVLAYLQDGKLRIKVIDFGIAKALTADRLTDLTLHTAGGVAIGTYATMSPEQAAGSPDIDTRTDVYSLGVLLYELLTGVAPFDPRELERRAHDEVRHVISQVPPPTPSTRLTTLSSEEAEELANARQIAFNDLRHRLKSELEWIPLKAIRKERDRRYGSAAELSKDIHHYLNGIPLVAAPESKSYLLRKAARRHARPLVIAGAFLAALMLGLAGTTIFAHRAMQESKRAVSAEKQAVQERNTARQQRIFADESRREAEAANLEAQQQRASSSALASFFVDDVIGAANPEQSGKPDIGLLEAIKKTEGDLAARTDLSVPARAQIYSTLGEVFTIYSDYEKAEKYLKSAYKEQLDLYGESNEKTLDTLRRLSKLYGHQHPRRRKDRVHFAKRYSEVASDFYGPGEYESLFGRYLLGCALRDDGRAEAEQLFINVERDAIQYLGRTNNISSSAMNSRGVMYRRWNRFSESEKLLKESLGIHEKLYSSNPHIALANSYWNLANLYRTTSRFEEALEMSLNELKARTDLYGWAEPADRSIGDYRFTAKTAFVREPSAEHFSHVMHAVGLKVEKDKGHKPIIVKQPRMILSESEIAAHINSLYVFAQQLLQEGNYDASVMAIEYTGETIGRHRKDLYAQHLEFESSFKQTVRAARSSSPLQKQMSFDGLGEIANGGFNDINGRVIVTSDSSYLAIDPKVGEFDSGSLPLHNMEWHANGTGELVVAVSYAENHVSVWSLPGFKRVAKIACPARKICSVSWRADGLSVWLGDSDGNIYAYNALNGIQIYQAELADSSIDAICGLDEVDSLAYVASRRAYTANMGDGLHPRITLLTNNIHLTDAIDQPVFFSPTTKRIAVATRKNGLLVWEVDGYEIRHLCSSDRAIIDRFIAHASKAIFVLDGKLIAVSGWDPNQSHGSIALFNSQSGELLYSTTASINYVRSLALGKQNQLLTFGMNPTVQLWAIYNHNTNIYDAR